MAVPGYADYNNDEEDSFSGQDYDLDDADNDININDEGDPFLNRYLDRYHTNSTFTPPPQPDFSPIFLTCDDQGGLNLYDIRTAFTSKHHIPLKTFNTRLGRVKESLIQYARKFDISSAK